MQDDEPGLTLSSLFSMLKRKKIRPVEIVMSTCGHCKKEYDIHKGHMCPYIKELYSKLEES